MKSVIVSVSNNLVTDQRVAKVCQTLHQSGFTTMLIGRKNNSKHIIQRDYPTKRLKLLFNHGFLFYATFNIKLFFVLLFSKKDILYANDVDTLLANYLVAKIQRKELIFDSHELFSEVPELIHKPFVKWFWKRIEKTIIPKVNKIITVSYSIKNYYKKQYQVDAVVIKNVPIQENMVTVPFSFNTNDKIIILYQGSINVGRGLELIIDSMKLLNNHVLVIIGDGDILTDLQQKVIVDQLQDKVKFTGKVLPSDLKKLTPNADIGISLEEDLGLNYRYALPNKVFDYIQAEVPVLVANLPEMKQLVTDYKVGEILKNRTAASVASQISDMSNKDYTSQLRKAKKELNWNNEEKKLLDLINS